jgi:hypothetical protein
MYRYLQKLINEVKNTNYLKTNCFYIINNNYNKKRGFLKMSYSQINKKNGKTYYLHKKGHLFFFSGDPKDSIDLPAEYKVIENKRTGLPMLKKK